MTTTIARTDAETNFGGLLERVRAGDRFVITDNGQAVAVLAPAPSVPPTATASVQEIIAQLKAARDRRPMISRAEIRATIEEGRR